MNDKEFNVLAEKIKKQRITPLQKYQDTVNEYLTKRLAEYDMPDYVKMEIAQFMANQTMVFLYDELHEVRKAEIMEMKRSARRYGNIKMSQNET